MTTAHEPAILARKSSSSPSAAARGVVVAALDSALAAIVFEGDLSPRQNVAGDT